MAGKRVPIPWKQRWQRFRHGTLPLVCFLASVAVTLWLWDRQGQLPNAVGEVEALRIDIVASADGVLVPLGGRDWEMFDPVPAGAVAAQLDDRAIRADVARIQMDLEATRRQLEVRMAQLELEARVRENIHLRDAARLAADLERYRLTVLDRRAQVEIDRVELAARQARVEFLAPMHEKNIVGEIDYRGEELLRDLAARRVAENETLLVQAEQQQRDLEALVAAVPDFPADEIDRVLAPVRLAVSAGQTDVAGLGARVQAMELRSPIAGTICALYRRPGQAVRTGDVIMTVASEDAQYVVSYLRPEQRVALRPGMAVDLRPRAPAAKPLPAVIDRVGPQVELIPPHQLRDPNRPEWGLPVRIMVPKQPGNLAVPMDLRQWNLRPGELIDVTFRPDRVRRSG
jgi:multidrug resistance efflux pump